MGAIQDALEAFGKQTVQIIQGNLSSTGTNASGETSNSVKSAMIADNRVQVTGKPFIFVVETGRKPGKMPPISNILKWIESGKPDFNGSAISFAWAISKRIAKSGSWLFRKGGREDIITPAISEDRIDKLVKDIADIELETYVKVFDNGTGR